MQLRYGNYQFTVNATSVTSESEAIKSEANLPYAWRVRLKCKGFLEGSGQADLSTKQSLMELAMRIPNQNLGLFRDDGQLSATKLLVTNSISGVVVDVGPNFTGTRGDEYATHREFYFEAYAEYPLFARENFMMSFQESLSIGGGGPIYIHKRALNGLPQKQQLYPATEFTASQTGTAVGYRSYPPFPGPIWPGNLKQAPVITRLSPKRNGYGLEQYTVQWDYQFESAFQLVGFPSVWIGSVLG